jgi:hypothetical protein
MKKIATTLVLCAVAAVSYGQGNVNFANTSGPLVSTNGVNLINSSGNTSATPGNGSIGLTTGSGAAPSGFYFALLMQSYSGSGATAGNSLSSIGSEGWIYSGVLGQNALGAGKIAGGANSVTTAGDALPAGTPNQFVVVGWSANEGTTWAQVLAEIEGGTLVAGGYIGTSAVGTGISATSPSEQIFGGTGITSAITLNGVAAVPEPGTMALAGLGGLSLLAFRRKNSKWEREKNKKVK